MPKKITITTAKKIAEDFGYSEIIIFGFDRETCVQHVTTYGKTLADCENAAEGGNAIKKLLKWPDELCDAKPSRVKNKKPSI